MHNYIPDHPMIRNAERSGYPDGKSPVYPVCPVCGNECEDIYMDMHGELFGCELCRRKINAWEVYECFPHEK